jgi:hypothetical protein
MALFSAAALPITSLPEPLSVISGRAVQVQGTQVLHRTLSRRREEAGTEASTAQEMCGAADYSCCVAPAEGGDDAVLQRCVGIILVSTIYRHRHGYRHRHRHRHRHEHRQHLTGL